MKLKQTEQSELSLQYIFHSASREKLAKAITDDDTLSKVRKLDDQMEGYH